MSDSTLPPPHSASLSQILRPRNIGDILDTTIRLYRRHFGLYFSIVMIVQAIIFVVSQSFQIPNHFLMRRFTAGADANAFDSPEALLALLPLAIPMAVGFVLLVVVAVVGYQFSTGGLVTAVSETFLARSIAIGEAYRTVVARFWSLFGAGLLSFLLQFAIVMVGSVFCVVMIAIGAVIGETVVVVALVLVGLGGLGLSVLGAIYIFLIFLLAPQVVMLEHANAMEALRRSRQLMSERSERGILRNNVFRAGVILLIVTVINFVISLLVQLPIWILFIIVMVSDPENVASGGTLMPLWLQIPAQLLQSVATAAVMPVGIIAMILFYYDIRIRFEGFDLQVLAGELPTR